MQGYRENSNKSRGVIYFDLNILEVVNGNLLTRSITNEVSFVKSLVFMYLCIGVYVAIPTHQHLLTNKKLMS